MAYRTQNNKDKGNTYEDKTVEYLKKTGMEVLDRNYRCRFGEVDLVCEEDRDLVFVEVKYRMNGKYGHPSAAINYYKRRNIVNVSRWYVQEKKRFEQNVRYDVAIWFNGRLEYYKGAFDYDG